MLLVGKRLSSVKVVTGAQKTCGMELVQCASTQETRGIP